MATDNDSSSIPNGQESDMPYKTCLNTIYGGYGYGRDYRFGAIPDYPAGRKLKSTKCQGGMYRFYLAWLVRYLEQLQADPLPVQAELCGYLELMHPGDGIVILGSNAAHYQLEAETVEINVAQDETFEDYWDVINETLAETSPEELEELGYKPPTKESAHAFYEQVKAEMILKETLCPDSNSADVGYQLALAIVLRKEPDFEKRVGLLEFFYGEYNDGFK